MRGKRMDKDSTLNPPRWYWALGVILLIWNLFGVFVFAVMILIASGSMELASEQALSEMEESQRAQTIAIQEVIMSTPTWVNVAFAFAVGCGVLGSLSLLMRRKIAVPLFIVSLIAVLVQNSYQYLLSDAVEKVGVGLSPVVILVAGLSIAYALLCSRRNWI
jgi:uncharacterized membrane protein (Fun14 family)